MRDWRQDAACAGSPTPDARYTDDLRHTTRTAAAQAVCSGCPVQDACLDWAMDQGEPHGIWGGLTAQDRIDLGLTARDAAIWADAARAQDQAAERERLADWRFANMSSERRAGRYPTRPVGGAA